MCGPSSNNINVNIESRTCSVKYQATWITCHSNMIHIRQFVYSTCLSNDLNNNVYYTCLLKILPYFHCHFQGTKWKNKKYHNIRTILKSGISATYTPLSEQFQNPIHLFTFISTISMQHPENKVLCSVIFYRVVP